MPTILGAPPVVPVLLSQRAAPFDDPAWMFEPKYDGVRAFVHASASECQIRTVQELSLEALPELRGRVAGVLGMRDVILDGQIVSLDPKGRPVLRDLLKGLGFVAFAAFDLLWLDGEDLRPQPLGERKRRLAELLPSDTGPLYKVFTLAEHGRALFEATRKMELDGVVAKRLADPYAPDTRWYAIRNPAYRQRESWGELAPPRRRAAGVERGMAET